MTHDSPINQPDPMPVRQTNWSDRACFVGFLALFIVAFGLMLLAGCSSTPIPLAAPAQNALNTAESNQSSKASASVGAASVANQSNPDGNPKVAVAGELGVASANLPVATPSDANAALARVNQALTGQLSDAQKGWNTAIADANVAKAQIVTLTTQVAVEQATAAAAVRNAEIKVWQTRMMGVGVALFLMAAGLTAAGVFIGIPKLYQVAIVPAAFAALALFAAYEAGTALFNALAFVTIAGAVLSLAYGAYTLYSEGTTNKTAASGFNSFVNVMDTVAKKAKNGVETGAVKLWDYCYAELSTAEQKLFGKTAAPTTPPIEPPAAPSTPVVAPVVVVTSPPIAVATTPVPAAAPVPAPAPISVPAPVAVVTPIAPVATPVTPA